MGLSVGFELQIVGTGVLDGPSPTHRGLLSDLCYSRTVEDCIVQYDSIQVVQDDGIQFCGIIKA